MSDHVLKASIRQTLAYIEAYDVELLRAIEASFKEALSNCNDEGEGEGEGEGENATAKEQAVPAPPPPPEPQPTPQPMQTAKPTKTTNVAAPATEELFELPAWHYQMPLIAAIATTALLFILAR